MPSYHYHIFPFYFFSTHILYQMIIEVLVGFQGFEGFQAVPVKCLVSAIDYIKYWCGCVNENSLKDERTLFHIHISATAGKSTSMESVNAPYVAITMCAYQIVAGCTPVPLGSYIASGRSVLTLDPDTLTNASLHGTLRLATASFHSSSDNSMSISKVLRLSIDQARSIFRRYNCLTTTHCCIFLPTFLVRVRRHVHTHTYSALHQTLIGATGAEC